LNVFTRIAKALRPELSDPDRPAQVALSASPMALAAAAAAASSG
jgi:hypothetical protein